jgi:predicted metal-binding membrane protein
LTGVLFVGGWVLMLTAMMLPTTLPLLDIFRRLTAQRADRLWLLTLVMVGYFAIWTVFGLVARLAGWAVLNVVRQSDWLTANAWAIGAAVLTTAGLYQFSGLKYRCLDKCRARSALSSSIGAALTRNGRPSCSAAATALFASAAAGP